MSLSARASRAPRRCLAALGLLAVLATPALAEDWKPVEPAQLKLSAPRVEPDADAEAIFWEIRVDDDVSVFGNARNVISHNLRIKVFNERGRDSQSRFDIPYFKGTRVTDIEARTIKPDGSILPLKKEDIHERTIYKLSGFKVQAKSFTLPGVEPGCMLDVRWRQRSDDQLAYYLRLPLQRDIPVQSLKLWVKPLQNTYSNMRYRSFQGQLPPFTQEKKTGFYSTSLSNVKAFHEEPYMPPENQVRSWVLIYYSPETELLPQAFWRELGKEVHKQNKDWMKPNGKLKKLAQEAMGDASTPEQKLDRVMEYCRTKVKNIWASSSGLSDEQRWKFKPAKSPEDTLERGLGNPFELYRLYAALAAAAGFEVRLALLADRSDLFFDSSFADPYVLQELAVAVKLGAEWRFYDPARALVPSGMLRWQQEGLEALICDEKDSVFVKTPLSRAERSVIQRKADLALATDGTLSGKVELELLGHPGIEQKYENAELSEAERETALRDEIKTRIATAEISEVSFENLKDPAQPLRVSYTIRVPGYASRTGKRLFLQPGLFQNGKSAVFTNKERRHQVYFHYPWSEEDHVKISLPAGFKIDTLDPPAPFTVDKLGRYEAKLKVAEDGSSLEYQRKFHFNGMLFPSTAYPPLKQVFDTLHLRDNQAISLKQGTEAVK